MQEWEPPAVIAVTPVRPLTATGVDELVVVPLPSWPEELRPQHLTVPVVSRAHECRPAGRDRATAVRPLTATGVDEFGGAAVAQLARIVEAPAFDGPVFGARRRSGSRRGSTAATPVRPLTATGTDVLVVVPLPS